MCGVIHRNQGLCHRMGKVGKDHSGSPGPTLQLKKVPWSTTLWIVYPESFQMSPEKENPQCSITNTMERHAERLAKVSILNHTKSKVLHPIWKEILTSQSITATLLPAIFKGERERRKGILDHCIIQCVLTVTFGACHTRLLIILKDGYERGWRMQRWMI